MTIEEGTLVSIGLAGAAIVNGWFIYAINEGKKDRAHLWTVVTEQQKALADFKEKVAKEHVTTEMLVRFEERIVGSIDRLTERLDRLFGRQQPGS